MWYMHMTNQAQQIDNTFQQLQQVVNALDWARKHDLDLEWLQSFLDDYCESNNLPAAVQHANREWDL